MVGIVVGRQSASTTSSIASSSSPMAGSAGAGSDQPAPGPLRALRRSARRLT